MLTCVPGGMTCPSIIRGSRALSLGSGTSSLQTVLDIVGDIRMVSSIQARKYSQPASSEPPEILTPFLNLERIS